MGGLRFQALRYVLIGVGWVVAALGKGLKACLVVDPFAYVFEGGVGSAG